MNQEHIVQSVDSESKPVVQGFVCEACDWKFIRLDSAPASTCPHCFSPRLAVFDPTALGQAGSPNQLELAIPVQVSSADLEEGTRQFVSSIWFPPVDLSPAGILSRLSLVYLPRWLVDVHVRAGWQMDAGYDYQVVSHQDQFDENSGGWTSRQLKEGRVRWEPRRGTLQREYLNVIAPALEQEATIRSLLGQFDVSRAARVTEGSLKQAWIRLPDRETSDAWGDAVLKLKGLAAGDCQRAARADHSREYNWNPEFSDHNWTLLLEPVFTSWYQDDQGMVQRVFIHGQTGKFAGERKSSFKRARNTTFGLLIAAVCVFILSVLAGGLSFVLPVIAVLAVIGLVCALLLGVGAIVPLVMVWWGNRNTRLGL